MDFIYTYVNSSGIGNVQHLTNAKFDDAVQRFEAAWVTQ